MSNTHKARCLADVASIERLCGTRISVVERMHDKRISIAVGLDITVCASWEDAERYVHGIHLGVGLAQDRLFKNL